MTHTVHLSTTTVERLQHRAEQDGRTVDELIQSMLDMPVQSPVKQTDTEAQVDAIINASLDAFYLMESVRDTHGDIIDFRIVEINDNAVKQLNLPRATLIGGLIRQVFPINDTGGFFESYKRVAETGTPLEQEFYIPSDNIASGWYRHQVVKVDDGIAITTRDITDRKHSEELILENERMTMQFQKEQEHNVLIQRVISTLSHDLRTPFAIMSSSCDILSRYYDKLSPQRRNEKLMSIERQIQFATNLVQDTIDLIRGKLEYDRFTPKRTNLATLCRISVQEVGSAYEAHPTMQFLNIGDIKMVTVDATLVSRILLNLLSNAIKYTSPDGDVRLELDQENDWVILRVTDTGVGISEDDLPHIFEPFFRTMDALDIDGTGLGLSIVRDCVDQHHGRIRVVSEVGIGTKFTVELPTNVEI